MTQNAKTSERNNLALTKKILSRSALFTLEVLEQIVRDAELFYVATSCKPIYLPVGFAAAKRIIAARNWQELRERLARMRHRKLIERRIEGGRLTDVLTERGTRLRLKLLLRMAPICVDGTLTTVSYDIPEDARQGRDAFRCLLKASGFRMVHRSYWVTEKDVAAPLRDWVRRKRLGKWVCVRLQKP